MTVLDQAMSLLEREPPPSDLEAQFDALETAVGDEERPLFDDLREALFIKLNK